MPGQWLESADGEQGSTLRPLHVNFPLLVSFLSESFATREFTLNLDLRAIYIPTEQLCPCGTRGTIKFRISSYEKPFELAVEVVRVIAPEEANDNQPAGIGMQFVDVSETVLEKLDRMIDGVQSGSAVCAIRASLTAEGTTLDHELRSRPTDQKVMFALQANGREIDALIRETIPVVMLRLLENPRLSTAHLIAMLRNPKLNTRVLSAIKAKGSLLNNAEPRYLFCIHMQTQATEALEQLCTLPLDQLRKVAADRQIRVRIRSSAEELLRTREPKR